jgi:hypothetical protein
MIMGPEGPEAKDDCTGEDQQQFNRLTDHTWDLIKQVELSSVRLATRDMSER